MSRLRREEAEYLVVYIDKLWSTESALQPSLGWGNLAALVAYGTDLLPQIDH